MPANVTRVFELKPNAIVVSYTETNNGRDYYPVKGDIRTIPSNYDQCNDGHYYVESGEHRFKFMESQVADIHEIMTHREMLNPEPDWCENNTKK